MVEGQGAETGRDALLGAYRMMVLIREFEERVRVLSQGGLVPGLVHLAAGQEAAIVGTCMSLRQDDWIASHHRGHGHCLAKGADPTRLLAEILGRVTGYCRGRSGSMHVFDRENCNLGTNGIVGGGIPLATGAGLSIRSRGEDRIAVAYFGDGAMNQGLLPECMNMAAIWSLPVVFVCENNGFGEFTATDDVTAGHDLLTRGGTYDIPSVAVDGMDLLAVDAAFRDAADRARRGDGPTFLILGTYRYGGHHAGDKQDYKTADEIREWQEKDPIPRLARHLLENGLATDDDLSGIAAAVRADLAEAVKVAKAAPEAEVADLSERALWPA